MIDVARVHSHGGLAYGLELAQQAALGLPILVAPWRFVPLGGLDAEAVSEASAALGPMVLRWSAARQDEFTPDAMRGDKERQINFIPAGRSREQIVCVTAATAIMPVTTVGAVLQQSLDLSSGCLFDLETRDASIELEFRTRSARLLIGNREGHAYTEQIGEDTRLPCRTSADIWLRQLSLMVQELPRSTAGWHIEGAQVADRVPLRILQLRPIPGDRPVADTPRTMTKAWGLTRFVWGVFDIEVSIPGRRAVTADGKQLAVYIRDDLTDHMEPKVVAALVAGENVLLINRASGFRLTHEPFNLPATELRSRYFAVHLPPTTDASFRIVSDGDIAQYAKA